MTDTILVALISASGSVALGVTALIVNMKMFGALERQIERLDRRMESMDQRLGRLEVDLARLMDHAGLKP